MSLTHWGNCCTWTCNRCTEVTLTEISQRLVRIEAAENEMPAADLHASTGSLHIIKAREAACSDFISVLAHTGYIRALPTDLSRLSLWTAFPAKREMSTDEIYMCMWDEIHFRTSTCSLWLKKELFFFSLVTILFPTIPSATRTAIITNPEIVMDIHM